MTNPSRSASNGRAAVAGVIVVAGRQGPDDVERPERERRQRDLAAARDRRIHPALAQVARAPPRGRPRPTRTSWPSTGSGRARRGRCPGWPAPRRRTRRGRGSGRPGGCPSRDSARAGPRRRRCPRAPSRGRSRSAPATAAPSTPGANPASSRASRPAAMPIWLNRSRRRAWSAGMNASGSKSSTWAATCERNGDGSKRSIRVTGERAGAHPGPERVDADAGRGHDPDAGDPDAAAVGHVGVRRRRLGGLDGGHGLGQGPERRQRATGDGPS